MPDSGEDAACAWEAWLAECLSELHIDADVFGPYVTGILEDVAQPESERASSVRELLNDASPSGAVADGVVERLTLRWEARRSDEAAAAAAASNALLAKYAADAAAQRVADEEAAAARRLRQAEEAVLDKRQFLAQLDAVDASSEEEPEEEDEEDDVGGGAARGATSQEVQRAREAMQRAALERREAINRATEREERKRAEHEARRAVREQAGHTNSKPGGRGRAGADGKGDTKRRGCA